MELAAGSYLKKAIREIERSSCGVRDDAKMERKTAGVTGMRREESDGGCTGVRGLAVAVVPVPLVVEEEGMLTPDQNASDCIIMINHIRNMPILRLSLFFFFHKIKPLRTLHSARKCAL
jgi:hypothetical protein